MAFLGVDLTGVQGTPDTPPPIPQGWYSGMIVESTPKTSAKNPNNKLLEVKVLVIEGEYEGRHVYDSINYINDTEVAQRIGKAKLKDLANIAGLGDQVQNSDDLHNKPFNFECKVEPERTDNGKTYAAKNKIEKYRPYEDLAAKQAAAAEGAPGVAASAAQPTTPAVDNRPAWERDAAPAPAQ